MKIRESRPFDIPAIEEIYPRAFPSEDLLPLVRSLLSGQYLVLSLVGITGQTLVGHAVFTLCSIVGKTERPALLGPLAVAPDHQGKGIGGSLIREGFRRTSDLGATQVHVLGDPAYYGRFGFRPDADVTPPYPLPDSWRDAWQSALLPGGGEKLKGKLSVPPPWRQPALWTP